MDNINKGIISSIKNKDKNGVSKNKYLTIDDEYKPKYQKAQIISKQTPLSTKILSQSYGIKDVKNKCLKGHEKELYNNEVNNIQNKNFKAYFNQQNIFNDQRDNPQHKRQEKEIFSNQKIKCSHIKNLNTKNLNTKMNENKIDIRDYNHQYQKKVKPNQQKQKYTNKYLNHITIPSQKQKQNKIKNGLIQNQRTFVKRPIRSTRSIRSISSGSSTSSSYHIVAEYRRKRLKSQDVLSGKQNNYNNENNFKNQYLCMKQKIQQPTFDEFHKNKAFSEQNILSGLPFFNRRKRIYTAISSCDSSKQKQLNKNSLQLKVNLMKQHLKLRNNSLDSHTYENKSIAQPYSNLKNLQQRNLNYLLNHHKIYKSTNQNHSQKEQPTLKTKSNDYSFNNLIKSVNQTQKQTQKYKILYNKSLQKIKNIQKQLQVKDKKIQIQNRKNELTKQLYKSEIQKLKKIKSIDKYSGMFIQQYKDHHQRYKKQSEQEQIKEEYEQTKQQQKQEYKDIQQLKDKLKNSHLYTYKDYSGLIYNKNSKIIQQSSSSLLKQNNNSGSGESILNIQSRDNDHLNVTHNMIVQLSAQLKGSSVFNYKQSYLQTNNNKSGSLWLKQNSQLLNQQHSNIKLQHKIYQQNQHEIYQQNNQPEQKHNIPYLQSKINHQNNQQHYQLNLSSNIKQRDLLINEQKDLLINDQLLLQDSSLLINKYTDENNLSFKTNKTNKPNQFNKSLNQFHKSNQFNKSLNYVKNNKLKIKLCSNFEQLENKKQKSINYINNIIKYDKNIIQPQEHKNKQKQIYKENNYIINLQTPNKISTHYQDSQQTQSTNSNSRLLKSKYQYYTKKKRVI